MRAGVYVDPALHYEAAAKYCARMGYSDPMLVHALLDIHQCVLDDIDANPQDWKQRVAEYAYALSMS